MYEYLLHACSCEDGKYLASLIVNSVIMYDEIIDAKEKETIPTNFNEEKATCKTHHFYILPAFLLITIAILIDVSIYCYLVNY